MSHFHSLAISYVYVHHTCPIHASYIRHATSSVHGPNPGPEFVGWPFERVSTAALAQQSKGWCVRSGTIKANTRVPRAPYSSLDGPRFKGFSPEKGNEPPGLCRNDPGYPESVVEGLRSVTRYLRRILSEWDPWPHSK
jgi:hypothetical protein